MKKTEKIRYVEQWRGHIRAINALGMNPDDKLSKRIFDIVKELEELVPLIADAKIKHTLETEE